MFKWYREYLIKKYLRKLERGIIDTDNYKYVGSLLRLVVHDYKEDMIPRSLGSLKVTFSSGNGLELLNTFKNSSLKLKRGESISIHYNRSNMRIGDWATDGSDRPLRLNVYLIELSTYQSKVEAMLDDIGSRSQTDLEFYVNSLASSFMDVVKLSKILIRK